MQASENTLSPSSAQLKPSQTPPEGKMPLQPSPPNAEKRAMRRLGPYEFSLDQRIGSGATGEVYVGINTQIYELVCIKVIERAGRSQREKDLLQSEIRCQQLCSSKNTVKLLDTFDTSSFTFIVSDFCQGGDLYHLLKSHPQGLSQDIVCNMARQLANGMLCLKQKGVIHRDIKSENILLQKNTIKLGDFGFAIEESKLDQETRFNLGSPLYMSLQVLEQNCYSYASDIFSYGVVLYEMLHKECPWQCENEKNLINRIKNELPQIKTSIEHNFSTLIKKCLSVLPEDRPTIEEIVSYWNQKFEGKRQLLPGQVTEIEDDPENSNSE